ELARIEQTTRERLAMVPTPAKVAAAAKAASPARSSKHALPVDKVAAKVRDVRFADDENAERVILDMLGNSEATVVRADEHGAVLKIARADLPKKLERTLDASALKGPIRSVSTYADADDPGAVRVEVALANDGPHAPPTLVRDGGTLTWEFPRGTRSLPPAKVAAYGVELPLQVATVTPAVPQRNGRQRKTFSGRRIDLDFKDADIHNILKLIADVAQVNVVAAEDVKGTITIRLRDVPWDQALDIILRAKGLGMQREGNLIRVAPQAVLEKEVEAEVARAKSLVELKPLDTRLISLSYADGAQILPRIQEVMSSRGHVSVDARTNQLIVTDVAANISLAEDLVRNLDTQTPQVLIEARIVEADTTFERDIGIQWGGNTINSTSTGNPTGIVFPSTVGLGGGATDTATSTAGLQGAGAASPNFAVNMPAAVGTGSGGALGLTLGSVNGNYNINLRLSALENTGWVRIVSSPKIMTLDNIEATIEQGTSIPVSVVSAAGANTMFVDAKLNLTVKPHVTNEGSILMTVLITRNEPDFVNTAANGTPTIQKKQAHSQMLVRDGDTAVIGGIYTRNSGLSYTKVPWFADIPVIGWLFKARKENDNRTELLIFITPRIINRSVVTR
ncbi:MAG TPA: type IV pilus secretin PilQ, partial [Polyangia bacterium]|nr:type IV pilus secretin PilQ [Polyangia bacterium]